MISNYTRMAVFLLSGFFFSCSQSYTPLAERPEMAENNLQAQIASLAETLSEGSADPVTWHKSGLLKSNFAKLQPVEARSDLYTSMRSDLLQAFDLYPDNSRGSIEKESIRQTLKSDWQFEHNAAAGIFNSDSTSATRLAQAHQHIDHAITILSDSIISYELKSDLFMKQNQITRAIQAVVAAVDDAIPGAERLYERIAYLYNLSGNLDASATWYHRAVEAFAANTNLVNGYINVLLASTRYDEALMLIDRVQSEHPEELIYRGIKAIVLLRIVELESGELSRITYFNHFTEAAELLVGQDPALIANAGFISSNSASNLYGSDDTEGFERAVSFAIEMLQTALALNPDQPMVSERLAELEALLNSPPGN